MQNRTGNELAFTKAQGGSGDGYVYKGAVFGVLGDVDVVAGRDVHMEAPVIFTHGNLRIEAEKGNILGVAMLGQYLDKFNSHETSYAITGSSGIISTPQNIFLLSPEGKSAIKGIKITADGIAVKAKEIELSGIHESATQWRGSVDHRTFSESVRQTWESHTVALLTDIAAKHVDLLATDKDILLKGVNIKIEGGPTKDGMVNTYTPKGKVLIEDYKIPHFVKTVEEVSGFSFGGIFGLASAPPHEGLKDVVVQHIPVINAVNSLSKMKSATDLAPGIQVGVEALRILTAGSVGEVITDQLGINIIGGVPVPGGFSFYKTVNTDQTSWEQSIPTVIDITRGKFLSESDEFVIEGSAIITKDGKVHIIANKFTDVPSRNKFWQKSETESSSVGVSFSPTSVGVQYSESSGDTTTSGHTLSHSSIHTQNLRLDIAGDATIGSPIQADTIEGKIGGNLLVETYQEISNTRSKYNSWSAGVNVDFSTGVPLPAPSWSLHFGRGDGDKKWAEIPAVIKGNNVYLDVGKKCILKGGGILGKNVTLSAEELEWIDIHNQDRSKETSFGFDSGMVSSVVGGIGNAFSKDLSFSNGLKMSGELAGRAGSVVKGWFNWGKKTAEQEGIVRATISKEANVILKGKSQAEVEERLKGLNREEEEMVWTGKRDEKVVSFAIPVIDYGEVKRRWENKETLLQQMIGDKNLPEPQREFAEAEQEVTKVIKEEAVKEGLTPEEVEDVITELTEEEYAAKNLIKLSKYHEGQDIPVEEVIEVLQGKHPVKDDKGEISFSEAPKQFDKYKEEPIDRTSNQQDSSEQTKSKGSWGWGKPMEPWEEEAAVDDIINTMTLGAGGAAIKIGVVGKTILKGSEKAISKGIKPAIEALKGVSKKLAGSKVKVEVVKGATEAGKKVVENVEIKFTKTAAEHMKNPDRYIPSSLLNGIVKNTKSFPDPQGSSARMFYSEIFKNGNRYNAEVLYDLKTKTILHFKYTTKAIGPLPVIN